MKKLITVLLIILSTQAEARKIWLTPNGNPNGVGDSYFNSWTVAKLNTINLVGGDTVWIAGDVPGVIVLDEFDVSTRENPIVIRGDISRGGGSVAGIEVNDKAGVEIRYLRVKYSGTSNTDGILFYVDKASDTKLPHVILDSVEVSGFVNGAGFNMGAWDTNSGYDSVIIRNSVFYGNGKAGINIFGNGDAYSHKNVTVYKCQSYNNLGVISVTDTHTGSGIVLGGVDGAIIGKCDAYGNGENNRGTGGGPVGIWFYNVKNGRIYDCVSYNNKSGLSKDGGGFDIDGGSQNCIIENCSSYRNDGPGYLFAEYGSTNAFSNNIIRNNRSDHDGQKQTTDGVLAFWTVGSTNPMTGCLVENNFFVVGSTGVAIGSDLQSNSSVTVRNNTFYVKQGTVNTNNTTGLTLTNNRFLPDSTLSRVKVYVYTDATPTAVAINPAPQKYNAHWWWNITYDDSNKEGYQMYKYSQKYTYDDGTGKRIPFRNDYALNARNNWDNTFTLENYPTKMKKQQVAEALKAGWAASNHGFYHFDSTVVLQGGTWTNAAWFPQRDNIRENNKYMYKTFGELGVPFSMRVWFGPGDSKGYVADVEDLGMMATSSTTVFEGYPIVKCAKPITIPTISRLFYGYERDFSDQWDIYYRSTFIPKIDSMVALSSASVQKMFLTGSHLNSTSIPYIDSAYAYVASKPNGWISSLHEFLEYHEIKRLVDHTKEITTKGTVTEISYDFSGVPDINRWRDMSLLLNVTGANVTSIYVTGVDDYTYNLSTGLVNLYSEKKSGYSKPYGSERFTNVEIPMQEQMVVIDAYNRDINEAALVDTSSTMFGLGFGTFASDTVDVFIEPDPFRKKDIKINKVSFYGGSNSTGNPVPFYGVTKYTGDTVRLATFETVAWQQWTNFTVTDTNTFSKFFFRKLNWNSGGSKGMPGKLKLYGDYTNDTTYFASYNPKEKINFKRMFGANSYWYWVVTPGGGAELKTPQVDRIKAAAHTSRIRFYFDLVSHFFNGGQTYFFYQDSVFKWMHDKGVDVNLASKSMPKDWVMANYPDTINGKRVWPTDAAWLNNVVPAKWGSDWVSPWSYLDRGKYEYQIAARYGRNTNIPDSLINRFMTPDFGRSPDANVKGLGYVQYMSPGNENDKDWVNTDRWFTQSGEELAAQMSACYDGHKNTMGAGVGIKNADPTMIVLPPAFVTARNDNYMRMMRQWVIKNRGYRADGVTPDWPWDELDFHNYSNDAGGQYQSRIGKSHELSKAYGEVDTMLKFSGAYMNSMQSSISETGWDTRDTIINGNWVGTTQNAIKIGSKSVYQTQADWSARMQLVNWTKGITGIDFYELFDNQPTNAYNTMYVTTGLFFHASQGYWSGVDSVKAKASGNVLIQQKALLGDYVVDSVWVNPADSVWKVQASNGDSIKYVVWVGKQSGATATATVPIAEGVKYDLDYTDETSYVTPFTSSGTYSFTATETPTVLLKGAAADVVVDPPPVVLPSNKLRLKKGKRLILKQTQ